MRINTTKATATVQHSTATCWHFCGNISVAIVLALAQEGDVPIFNPACEALIGSVWGLSPLLMPELSWCNYIISLTVAYYKG